MEQIAPRERRVGGRLSRALGRSARSVGTNREPMFGTIRRSRRRAVEAGSHDLLGARWSAAGIDAKSRGGAPRYGLGVRAVRPSRIT
jgi:hypothetical protein